MLRGRTAIEGDRVTSSRTAACRKENLAMSGLVLSERAGGILHFEQITEGTLINTKTRNVKEDGECALVMV